MKIAVYNQKGRKTSDLTLSKIFDVKINDKNISVYVNYLRSVLRSPVANTKDRSEVSGGGRKPWRQKGTGNARAGSNRSPLWVGGGVTFGPTSLRNFKKRINSKEKRQVILSTFSRFVNDKKMMVIDSIKFAKPKTKSAQNLLNSLGIEGKISVVISKSEREVVKSFRNLNGVKVATPSYLDMIYLLSSDQLVITKQAISEIEEIFNDKDKNISISKESKPRLESAPSRKK